METEFFQAPNQKEGELGVRRIFQLLSLEQGPARGKEQVISPSLGLPTFNLSHALSLSLLLTCAFIICQMLSNH